MLKSKTAFNKLQIKNPGGFIVKELYFLFNDVINHACNIISDKYLTS